MKRVVLEVSCGLVYAILEELSKRHVSVSRSLAGLSSICPGCEEFMVNPPVSPGEKWDGVYRLTEK